MEAMGTRSCQAVLRICLVSSLVQQGSAIRILSLAQGSKKQSHWEEVGSSNVPPLQKTSLDASFQSLWLASFGTQFHAS